MESVRMGGIMFMFFIIEESGYVGNLPSPFSTVRCNECMYVGDGGVPPIIETLLQSFSIRNYIIINIKERKVKNRKRKRRRNNVSNTGVPPL